MNVIRFVAVLALICTSPLFAGGPVGDAAPTGDKKAPAEYVIQPPDVIQIEMLKVIPKPPYRAEVFDVFQIRANALPDQPIDSYYMVEAEGAIELGPTYGSVRVSGMTIDEIRTALNKSLHQWLKDSSVTVQLARVSGAQPVTGYYLVGPDGTINLREYGVVYIAGKTAAEARVAIQNHLKQFLDSPELSVDVVRDNGKVYYVITQGPGLGETIRRFPITGNETVLDAISQVNGLSQVSTKKIWIDRLAPRNLGHQILPIDWDSITQGAQVATNYQLLPGDRLIILADKVTAPGSPIERFSGILNVSESTIPSFQTMGRNYNRSRNGF